MIDSVYKTTLTILNKDNKGDISPSEFNVVAKKVQEEIFKEYFEDINRDNVKRDRLMSSEGYGNLPFMERQKIDQFLKSDTISLSSGVGTIPSDLYYFVEDGMTETTNNKVVEEVPSYNLNYLKLSGSGPSTVFPVYGKVGSTIEVVPTSISEVRLRYIKKPSSPQWTYIDLGGNKVYNPSSSTHQDFELHPSEFSNIVVRICLLYGVVIRDADVIRIMESMKNTNEIKDNQ